MFCLAGNDTQVQHRVYTETPDGSLFLHSRKSKYVCINDNIQNKTDELDRIIHDFYESFFPYPCQFEKGWSWGECVL